MPNDDLGRFGYKSESSFKTPTGSIVNVGALAALQSTPDNNLFPAAILRNAAGDAKAQQPGSQTYQAVVEVLLTDLTKAHWDAILAASHGAKVAASALAGFVSGTTGSVTKTSDAAVFDNWIRVVDVAGNTNHVFVKTKGDAPDIATFGWLLASAANAAPKNASQTGGAAYEDTIAGAETSFELYRDWSGRTGEIWHKAQGCWLDKPYEFIFTPNGLAKLRFSFGGAIYTRTALSSAASGLADVADNTEQYISDVAVCYIQDLQTPITGVPLQVKALTSSWGYMFAPKGGAHGASGGVIAGSNISGISRKYSGTEQIQVTILDPDVKTWAAHIAARTPLLFAVEVQPGSPTSSVGLSRWCGCKPRVKIVKAVEVAVDGEQCTALTLEVEREPSMLREYVSFFGIS